VLGGKGVRFRLTQGARARGRCHRRATGFVPEAVVFDLGWDLFGYAGYSPALAAMVIAFRGTDSHSLYNWAENMRYWRTDLHVPYPDAEGALVHTGAPALPPALTPWVVSGTSPLAAVLTPARQPHRVALPAPALHIHMEFSLKNT